MENPWKISLEGRAWSPKEQTDRQSSLPESCSIDAVDGMLFRTDEERKILLQMLLENVGLIETIRLVDLTLWRQAIEGARFRVIWSEEDKEYVGLFRDYPSLSFLAETEEAALQGIRQVAHDVDTDMEE